jgi:hypothetical protein
VASSTETLLDILSGDSSPFAIPRDRLPLVADLIGDIFELVDDGRPQSTRAQQRSNWKHWTAWCHFLGVNPWRIDTSANSGSDAAGAKREAFILAGGLRFIYNRMRPRRSADPVPQPQSALNVILGIRRMHKDKGYPMIAMPMVNSVFRGMMARVRDEYADSHPDLLLPKRKEPFDRAVIEGISNVRSGSVRYAGQPLIWESPVGKSLWALFCTLLVTGFRKSEVARRSGTDAHPIAMRGNLTFRVRGQYLDAPSPAQLASMQVGDCVLIRPPPSKADQFGTVWGASPIYLAWGCEPRNAARALVEMELADPISTVEQRRVTPLFALNGRALLAGHLDAFLHAMLRTFMSAAHASQYSWHSARIYLACALLAAGASTGQIQAICRWMTEQSLHIYARMNETAYTYWLNRAMRMPIDSVRATNLAARAPPTDDADLVRQLLRLNVVEGDT